MKILLVTEEYSLLTKGVFRVIQNQIISDCNSAIYEVLVNKEHWLGSDELNAECGFDVPLHRFFISMPITWVSYLISNNATKFFPFRVLKKFLTLLFQALIFLPIALYLIWWLRKKNFDYLICHHGGWPAGLFGRLVILSSRWTCIKKSVFVIHSYPSPYRFLEKYFLCVWEYFIGLFAGHVVTVSNAAKDALDVRNFRSEIRVIHNGLLLGSSNPLKFHVSPESVVLYIGAIIDYKGVEVLLDAFSKVRTAHSSLYLVGPGCPHYINQLKQKYLRGDLSKKIKFLGFKENVFDYIDRSNFVVMPSIRFESFGMVVLEAMLRQKAVICSDFGGMKEIVIDGLTGLIVPAGDAVKLAGAIDRLLEDSHECVSMGVRGFEHLTKNFTAERMSLKYIELLNKK